MGVQSLERLKGSCIEVSQMLKAMAHPQRLLILGHLIDGPKAVGDLVENCGATQSQISHFLMRMKLEGLVSSEREGRFVLYSIADKRLIRLMKVLQKEYCD